MLHDLVPRATAVALFALATACATIYEGGLAWGEGWRKAEVTEVAQGDRISRGATKDCREGLPSLIVAQGRYVRGTYAISRTRVSIIAPVTESSPLRPGDEVYVNVKTCEVRPTNRPSESRPGAN